MNVQCKRCGFTKTRLRHPSLPFDSLPYPTRTICRRARTYVRTYARSITWQPNKRGWPYSMSMGLWPPLWLKTSQNRHKMSAKMFLHTFCYSVCTLGEFWPFKNFWHKFNKLTPGFYVPVLLLMITLSKRSGSTMMLFLWQWCYFSRTETFECSCIYTRV